jgi:hypothetical protein|tara:strand:- start:168 stop:347 length:180 start_codon:yes stop_codon:yes gene_type:complete
MTVWTIIANVSQGYFETENNLFLLSTESGLIFQQEGSNAIAPDDWQDVQTIETTTWNIE